MTIKSFDFLRSSEHCLNFDEETGQRNAISRAYYSMYHRTLEVLENIPRADHNHHANVIKYMQGNAGVPKEKISANRLKVLAYELRQMRQARNEADYRLTTSSINNKVATEAIITAKHFFNRLSQSDK